MALPDYITSTPGTQIIWGPAGGTSPSVTKNMTTNNLANNAARQGEYVDLLTSGGSTTKYEEYDLELIWESGTAPTAGNTVELYMVESNDTTTFPGQADGTDNTYTVGNRFALGSPEIILYCLNLTNTKQKQKPIVYRPAGRYVAPVIVNISGQSSRNNANATNSACRVIMTPREPTQQDAA